MNTNILKGFPGSSVGKKSACNAGDLGLIPGLGRSPGEGKGYPLQYFGLENSMDCIVHGVARVGHNLATKPPLYICNEILLSHKKEKVENCHLQHHGGTWSVLC